LIAMLFWSFRLEIWNVGVIAEGEWSN